MEETAQYVPLPETSENSHLERLHEWSKHLSALNKSFEELKQNIYTLNLDPKDQRDFSKWLNGRLTNAYKKVKEEFASFHILEAANNLAKTNPTKASDKQRAQNLANATNKLNEAFEELESLKQKIMQIFERELNKRFKAINDLYKEVSATMPFDPEIFNAATQTYKDLAAQFEPLRENYGTLTYADCKRHLDQMETSLYRIVEERYPVARDTVSKAMKDLIEDADFIHTMLSNNGCRNHPYHPEVRRAHFERVRQKTMRNILTKRTEPKSGSDSRTEDHASKDTASRRTSDGSDHPQSSDDPKVNPESIFEDPTESIFEDLHRLDKELEQARKCCENVNAVKTQIRDSLDNMQTILERLQLSEMPANSFRNDRDLTWDFDSDGNLQNIATYSSAIASQQWCKTIQNMLRSAFLEGVQRSNGCYFEKLGRAALDVQQASKCWEKVSEVETQVRSDVSAIKSILERHNLNDTFIDDLDNERQQKLYDALREGALGTNGQAFDDLHQFASHVRKAKEDCETVNMIVSLLKKSSDGAEGHDFEQEQCKAFLEAVQGKHDRPNFELLEQKFEEEMQKQFNSYSDKIGHMDSTNKHFIKLKTDYQKRTCDQQPYVYLIVDLNALKRFSNEFKELRKIAQEKSGSERTKDNKTLMETLSKIEGLMQDCEPYIEKCINHRFRESQRRVAAILASRKPKKSLVKEHQEACKQFEKKREAIRTMSSDAKTYGYKLLGESLFHIEELEGKIDANLQPEDEDRAKRGQFLNSYFSR